MRSKAALCATVETQWIQRQGDKQQKNEMSASQSHFIIQYPSIYSSHPHRNFAGTCELTPHYTALTGPYRIYANLQCQTLITGGSTLPLHNPPKTLHSRLRWLRMH